MLKENETDYMTQKGVFIDSLLLLKSDELMTCVQILN